MTGEVTAGTASDGYRCDPEPHRYAAQPSDWGCRPSCRSCGEPQSHANHVGRRAA